MQLLMKLVGAIMIIIAGMAGVGVLSRHAESNSWNLPAAFVVCVVFFAGVWMAAHGDPREKRHYGNRNE